jgi:hypothetical protein
MLMIWRAVWLLVPCSRRVCLTPDRAPHRMLSAGAAVAVTRRRTGGRKPLWAKLHGAISTVGLHPARDYRLSWPVVHCGNPGELQASRGRGSPASEKRAQFDCNSTLCDRCLLTHSPTPTPRRHAHVPPPAAVSLRRASIDKARKRWSSSALGPPARPPCSGSWRR